MTRIIDKQRPTKLPSRLGPGLQPHPPGPPPVIEDSFYTSETVGPLPWWVDGGPTGTIQMWTPPYKRGLRFRALQDVEVLGGRVWLIGPETAVGPSDRSPKLCLSDAEEWAPATANEAFDDTMPPGECGWRTVMFDAPVPVFEGEEKLIWITNTQGSQSHNIARWPSWFAAPTESRNGLLETLSPSGMFGAPSIGGEFEAPLSLVDAYYWIDPIVTSA